MALSDEQLIDAGLRAGMIEAARMDGMRMEARRRRLPLLGLLQAHYRFPLAALYRAAAEQYGLGFIDVQALAVDPVLLKKIPPSLVQRKLVLPMLNDGQSCLVASDPSDRAGIDAVQRLLGTALPLVMADAPALRLKISQTLAAQHRQDGDVPVSADSETDLVALLDTILREAYLNRASDIHLLPEVGRLRVRLRVDGKLRDFPVEAGSTAAAALVSRVKVLAGLDIAEQRQAQDGGFSYQLAAPIERAFNVRVATIPTRLGERMTLRLLGQENTGLSLSDLGMMDADLQRFRKTINQPYGMILLTGPTGSGKSTTLFAALQEINQPDVNIMTVENPVEYVIDGVSQVQTGTKLSFADALRSFLRHDPDVLMVGEIRDHETADVAVKAAMTGHLVFSTLHTNNAVSAVTRLIDIGCESFLIASTMAAVIAQRLVRRLCPHCRKTAAPDSQERRDLGLADDDAAPIYRPSGCPRCQGTGYHGRIGLFETLWFDDQLARLVARGADEETLEESAGQRLHTMWEDGRHKVLLGLTTIDELRTVATPKNHKHEAVS